MSKKKSMIEIKPPEYVRANSKELIMSMGHTCSYCKGNGWFWGEDKSRESTKIDCPACKGSGMLDAVITVEWKEHPKD